MKSPLSTDCVKQVLSTVIINKRNEGKDSIRVSKLKVTPKKPIIRGERAYVYIKKVSLVYY